MSRVYRPRLIERAISFLKKRRRVKVVELMMVLGASPSTIYFLVRALEAWGVRLEGDGRTVFERWLVWPEEESG